MAGPEAGRNRTWKEQALDVGFSAFSVFTIPIWIVGGVGALAGANFIAAGGYGLLAASDLTS